MYTIFYTYVFEVFSQYSVTGRLGVQIIFYKAYYLARNLIRVKRRYGVSYFLFTSRLQKYCSITLILKMFICMEAFM